MEIFTDQTPLAWGLPLKLHVKRHAPIIRTIAEAAEFLRDDVPEETVNALHWQHARASLDEAARAHENSLIIHATKAFELALETDRLMKEPPEPKGL